MTAGTPRKIRLSKSSIGAGEKAAAMRAVECGYFGMGAEVQALENELQAYLGRPAVCVVNGSAALHLALQACGVGPGDEVLVPSLTFVACFQSVAATGAIPIACEIDPETCTLSAEDASHRVTKRTKAIMPMHYAGGIGNLEKVRAFAASHSLRVVEDAAHAFGTIHLGQPVGASGDVVCFSFDGIKNITCGEGGCIVTDDAEVLRRARDGRLLGVENDTAKRYAGGRSWDFDVTAQGWRYHMSDIMAAIGREQLARRPLLAARRQLIARAYSARLAEQSERIHPILKSFDDIVPHIYVVRIDNIRDRNNLRTRLSERGIETGVHYKPNHLLSHFSAHTRLPLPLTERIYPELLTLPLHPDLSEDDVSFVCDALIEEIG